MDGRWWVAAALAAALGGSGGPPAFAQEGGGAERRVQEWIQRLRTDPPTRRRRLMTEIRREAAPRGGHPPVRSSDRVDLLPVLAAGLANDDHEVRTQAVLTLCYMKCRDALPLLLEALGSADRTVRYYACMGVEWLGEHEDLRERIVVALRAARDREGEDHFDVRLHAATALQALGAAGEADVALFLQALRDPSANEALAASALADLGRRDALQLMITRLRTAVPSSDYHLGQALKKLTGQDLGTDPAAWQRWLDEHRHTVPEQVP